MLAEHVNEKSVFNIARRIDSREARAEYLEQVFGDNPEALGRVVALLQVHDQEQSFLEAPAVSRGELPPMETIERLGGERPGTQVGRYKLLEEIGEGGMGIVFVAEQTEPVRRRVALKIIKPGMDTKQVIARFEAERQALAMMDHPNIAKIFDAGTTGEPEALASGSRYPPAYAGGSPGRPYFVMELVRGMPVTEYCDKARLSPKQRLELFVDVCQAVQHAHQKGIIHRDLKPSNVLVTLHDGTPVVKVIDFGVAKAMGQQLTERTIYTALTQLVGTPLYMSPEQAEMSGLDVDTRSDVYSLGVLLYELLTGQTPFDKETLAKAGLDEMRRIIREDEPLRPSRRFSTLGAQAISTVSQHRSLDERRLSKILFGELDWIVMKALEKDRSRRYESASALAADIQRYLSDEPVLACPPTTMYRFQKFARKHKAFLTTAAAIAVCLLLGTTVSAWQAMRATTAEAQASANEAQAKEAAAAEAKQRQRAETNEQKANTERDEVKALADKLAAKEQQLQRTLYAAHMNLAQRAWDSGAIGRVNELLEQYRPKPGESDLRGFEWHYLYKLSHPELVTYKGGAAAFSPDGKRLAIAADDRVRILDTETNRELLSLTKGRAWQDVAFSPDSKRLATAAIGQDGEDEVKVWDAQTGQELHVFKGHDRGAWVAEFSPDGKRLASVGYEKAIIVRDVETGEEIFSVKGFVGDIAFSPDGKRIAGSAWESYGPVKVWDIQTGNEVLSLAAETAGNVVYSPDGKRLASGSGREVKVWDAQTGEELPSFKGQRGQINAVAFSPDGKRMASSGYGNTVVVWDAQTGDQLLTFKGHTSRVGGVVFNHDGTRLASGSKDGTTRIWDTSAKKESTTFSGAAGRVSSLRFSSDGKRMAGMTRDSMTRETAIKLWDVKTGQELVSLKQPAGNTSLCAVVISPDGKRLAAGFGTWVETKGYLAGDVKVWEAQTGQELLTMKGHTWAVEDLAFSPDSSRIVSCGSNPSSSGSGDKGKPCEVKVWDAASGEELLALKGHNSFVNRVAYSPDGKRLATLSRDDTVKVWDAQTGRELLSLSVLGRGIGGSVAFSPDGERIASTNNPGFRSSSQAGQIKLFNAQTGEELLTLQGHTNAIARVVFSPDGKRLVSSGGISGESRESKLWDAQTGEELLTFEKVGGGGVAFTPDGYQLVAAGAEGLQIYDATPLPEKP